MIRRLAHVCFVTDDLPRLREFYTQKLGLPVKFTFQTPAGEVFGHYLDAGDTSFIEIFDRKLMHSVWGTDGRKEIPAPELAPPGLADSHAPRCRHVCLEVSGLAEFRTLLESRGLTLTPLRRGMDRSLQSWTADPDGNPIELMEYTTESQQMRRAVEATPPVLR